MGDIVPGRRGISIRRLMIGIACVACVLGTIAWIIRSGASWELSQAFELSAYFYPRVAWAAGAGVLVALVAAVFDKRVWRIRSSCLLLPLVVPIAILAFGMAFAYDATPPPIVEQRKQVLGWLFWIHVPIVIVLLTCFRSASNWLIIAGFSTAAVWLSLGASILSWMSVTNIWL